jgi:hypothetical protein
MEECDGDDDDNDEYNDAYADDYDANDENDVRVCVCICVYPAGPGDGVVSSETGKRAERSATLPSNALGVEGVHTPKQSVCKVFGGF